MFLESRGGGGEEGRGAEGGSGGGEEPGGNVRGEGGGGMGEGGKGGRERREGKEGRGERMEGNSAPQRDLQWAARTSSRTSARSHGTAKAPPKAFSGRAVLLRLKEVFY